MFVTVELNVAEPEPRVTVPAFVRAPVLTAPAPNVTAPLTIVRLADVGFACVNVELNVTPLLAFMVRSPSATKTGRLMAPEPELFNVPEYVRGCPVIFEPVFNVAALISVAPLRVAPPVKVTLWALTLIAESTRVVPLTVTEESCAASPTDAFNTAFPVTVRS